MTIRFHLNGRPHEAAVSPHTTLLDYLRDHLRLTGTKEGCAEGDCGACTVVFAESDGLRAIDSCLILLPMVHGRRIWTVEGLGRPDAPHPVQSEVVEKLASQCGYCTPGVVMTLAELAHRKDVQAPWQIDDQICGNLCRCTGYRPIREAAEALCGSCPKDALSADCGAAKAPEALSYEAGARWSAPTSWDALFAARARDPEHRLVCGGTDLVLGITQRHERPPSLISVEHLPGMTTLETVDGVHRIGAAVPLADIETWAVDALPVLARMLRYFGSRQIKHRATLGGNLGTASPIGDTPPVLVALGATIIARGPAGERAIAIDDYFVGYRQTALAADEVVARVDIPAPKPGTRLGAYKVSRRREMDISAVSGCFAVEVDAAGHVVTARLAFGGMAATTSRARNLEAALVGRPLTEAGIEPVLSVIDGDFQPLDDHRGSAWYRRTVSANLVRGFAAEMERGAFQPLPDRPLSTIVEGAP